MMGRVDDFLTAETADPANQSQLAQIKLSLVEKLETLKQFNAEILELTEGETRGMKFNRLTISRATSTQPW